MKDVITYLTFKESPTLFWLRIHPSNTDSDTYILPQLAVSSRIFCVIYLVTITDTRNSELSVRRRSADFLWADEAFTATTIPEKSCMALLKRLLCLTKSQSNCLIIVTLPERTVLLSSASPLVAVARMKTTNCTLRSLVSIRTSQTDSNVSFC